MFPEIARDDVFRIETRRLWLRWPRVSDATTMSKLAGEKAVAENTATIPSPYSKEQAETAILKMRQSNSDGTGLYLTLSPLRQPQVIIGSISTAWHAGSDPVLGYWVGIPHWGVGLATEAAQAIIDITFKISSAHAVDAAVVPSNGASRRVLEKCGFASAGTGMVDAPARGGPRPVDFLRLDRATWQSLKGWREPGFGRAANLIASIEEG